MTRRPPLRRARWAAPIAFVAMAMQATPTHAEPRHGSEAQRLHQKGVHCMDVIERNKCAIENFEALLDLDTRERELAGDAMMRLIDLYRDEGREDDIAALLRRFWDVGMKRDAHDHVPWSTRFLAPELNILISLDIEQLKDARVMTVLKPDARDYLLTCDEDRRAELESKRSFRRAAAVAEKDGREVWDVVQEQREQEAERDKKRSARKAGNDESPIFVEALCPVVRALGTTDLRTIRRMAGAFNHHDARKSVGIAEIPDLDPMMAAAQESGAVLRTGPDRWILPALDYAGGPVHLVKLDHDELTIVPASLVADLMAARAKRTSRINRELSRLVAKVPRDADFVLVMTQAAMREIGFSGAKRSTRSVLEALLPKPKGLQVAAVFGDYVGLFTRVPTDTPVKGRMLVAVANAMLARAADDGDDEAQQWLAGLDIAESTDRTALLASYFISATKLEELMLQ